MLIAAVVSQYNFNENSITIMNSFKTLRTHVPSQIPLAIDVNSTLIPIIVTICQY